VTSKVFNQLVKNRGKEQSVTAIFKIIELNVVM